MSVEAVAWALKQPIKPSAAKFVLVAMADCVNKDTFVAWPSVASLVVATCQDRKTVLANIVRLRELGYIEDTGERKGTTHQIVVYRLKSPVNGPALCTEEQSQIRNSSESGTVPEFPAKSPVFPSEQSQISPETVPNQGHGTGIGTVKGTVREPEKKTRETRPSAVDTLRPDEVPESVWRDFMEIRKAKRAPLTATALQGIDREASRAGMTLGQALAMCCERGWQGFRADWVETARRAFPAGRESTEDHNRRAAAEFLGQTINDGRTIDA